MPLDPVKAPFYQGPYSYESNKELQESLDQKRKLMLDRYPGLAKLDIKLLSIAGGMLNPIFEEDLERILSRGVTLDGEFAHMMVGQASECHCNSARLWKQNEGSVRIATGYALSQDGLWRQHSWCVAPENPEMFILEDIDPDLPNGWSVIETTDERLVYFGFIMNDEEMEDFYDQNVW